MRKIWGYIVSFFKSLIGTIFGDKKETFDNNKVYIRYDKEQPQDDNEEWGTLYFKGLECRFISGRWGRGYAPRGIYRGYKFIQYDKTDPEHFKRMGAFGLSFQVPLEFISLSKDATPKEKERSIGMTGIAIHFDDPINGIEGTLGCFGLQPENLDHAVRLLNVFKQWFENNTILDVEVY